METVSATQVGIVLGVLIVLLGGVSLAISVFRRDPPLHKEFATKESVELITQRVDGLEEKIDSNFKDLREERSRSIARLHEKIENSAKESQSLIAELRGENKEDAQGLHMRINDLLGAFKELRGAILASSRNPFDKST